MRQATGLGGTAGMLSQRDKRRPPRRGMWLDHVDLEPIYTIVSIGIEGTMEQTAKIFTNGRSQAVRLPAAFRFDTKEVFIRQDAATGDVILSRRPATWDGFFAAVASAEVSADFLDQAEREQGSQRRDPFEGWRE